MTSMIVIFFIIYCFVVLFILVINDDTIKIGHYSLVFICTLNH